MILCRDLWFVFSVKHIRLSTSDVETEDEDVAYERSRVSTGDVAEDLLVLHDLTKVKLRVEEKKTISLLCPAPNRRGH